MRKIVSIIKYSLISLGGIFVLILFYLSVNIAIALSAPKVKENALKNNDVRYVLNWCELGESKIVNVKNSTVSARSFTGDYVDKIEIVVKDVSVEDLEARVSKNEAWYRCDKLPKVVLDAVKFSSGWNDSDSNKWFPDETEILTEKYYVYVWQMVIHGSRVSAAELVFINPRDNKVYFFGGKT